MTVHVLYLEMYDYDAHQLELVGVTTSDEVAQMWNSLKHPVWDFTSATFQLDGDILPRDLPWSTPAKNRAVAAELNVERALHRRTG